MCQKCEFHLELTKTTKDGFFGFAIEAEFGDDPTGDQCLQVYVCRVSPGGVADEMGNCPSLQCLHWYVVEL